MVRFGRPAPVYTPIVVEESVDKKDVDNPEDRNYSDVKEIKSALTDDEATVYEALTPEAVLADELVVKTGLPAQRVAAALTMLQIKKLAVKEAGNRCRALGK